MNKIVKFIGKRGFDTQVVLPAEVADRLYEDWRRQPRPVQAGVLTGITAEGWPFAIETDTIAFVIVATVPDQRPGYGPYRTASGN